jgi:hypothetical protein
MTIGTPQREFLVNFEFLKAKMNEDLSQKNNEIDKLQVNISFLNNTINTLL